MTTNVGSGKGKVTPVQIAFIVDRYLHDSGYKQSRSAFRAEASSLLAKSPLHEVRSRLPPLFTHRGAYASGDGAFHAHCLWRLRLGARARASASEDRRAEGVADVGCDAERVHQLEGPEGGGRQRRQL
ncbi:hypothetical protein NL676_034655 [Syzygium grande]|nr:hypothetical protein NL676_034655 [Syzygium grande]